MKGKNEKLTLQYLRRNIIARKEASGLRLLYWLHGVQGDSVVEHPTQYRFYHQLAVCVLTICVLVMAGCNDLDPAEVTTEIPQITQPAVTTEASQITQPVVTTEVSQITQPVVVKTPDFIISDLVIMPAEVKVRDKVGINVLVANNGEKTGSYQVFLEVNGQVISSKDITLDGGDSKIIGFQTSQEAPGTYNVKVNSLTGRFVVIPPKEQPGKPGRPLPKITPDEHSEWTIPTGSGTNFRAVNMGGNWGINRDTVPYMPEEYFLFLRDLNVNWVGISVALHVDGSMDSTVELDYDEHLQIPSFRNDVLRELIRTFHSHGFNVYIHMAFESGKGSEHPVSRWQFGDPFMHNEDPNISPEYWPWRIDHPQHQEFVAEFWQSYTDAVVHVASIAEEEGVNMMTLGTETDRLFRSRSGEHWPNHFLNEMQSMVSQVRSVFTGQLGYEEHYGAIVNRDYLGVGSDYIHDDLGLDFIGVSAYFQLMESVPNNVPTVKDLESRWDAIFNEHLKPLKQRNGNKPVFFTEFGYVDSKEALRMANADEFTPKSFKDKDGNGKDDGEEVQANAYAALFNVMDKNPGFITGAFLWDVNMATEQQYQQTYAQMRTFNIRGKLAEDVVREHYNKWR